MASVQEKLDRLRRYNLAVRQGDPRLAEESRDLGAAERTAAAPLSDSAAEALIAQESIAMRRERPVLAIKKNVAELKFADAADSAIWRDRLKKAAPILAKAIPAVGRINLQGGEADWIGTGWLVAEDKIVTNRHVAERFAERGGDGFAFKMGSDHRITADVDFLQEIDSSEELIFKLNKPLHIAEASGPDIAFFEIEVVSGNAKLAPPIDLATRIVPTANAATIGYPAYDSRIPEPDLMEQIYGRVYNKKRLAPGGVTRVEAIRLLHDCTTLGGNSGSAVIDLDSGAALGLHFLGSFLKTNYAVRADIVKRMLDDLRSDRPRRLREATTRRLPVADMQRGGAKISARGQRGSTISIPLTLRVTVDFEVDGRSGGVVRGRSGSSVTSIYDVDDQVEGEEAAPAEYADRIGYDEQFLGDDAAVALPQIVRNTSDILEYDNNGKTDHILRYEHFSVAMSRSRRMCFFSACNIDGDTSKKNIRGPWKWDPRISREQQIMKECYGTPPKFSRGHMTRREDPGWGSKEEAKRGADDSMHVTNTTPQMQAFNSPIWLALEDYALQHARQDAMRISVFTGPYLTKSDPSMYGVKIPLSFWKVIAFIHDQTRSLCATGYEMSQEASLLPEEEFIFGAFNSPHLGVATQVPISRIERKSGLHFGRLTDVDPLAGGSESLSEADSSIALLAMEQIRFFA